MLYTPKPTAVRKYDHAFIGFVRGEVPDYGLLRSLAKSSRVVLVLTDQAPPATRRALEQLRLQSPGVELIRPHGVVEHTLEEVVELARRDLGARSVEALWPPEAPAPTGATSRDGSPMRIEALNVDSTSHRSVNQVFARPDAITQVFLPLTPMPTTTRIQIEIDATWPAIVTFDSLSLIDARTIITIDPMEFERHIAHYNSITLGLDESGFRLLCTGGTLVLQLLESTVALLAQARLLELQLRWAPAGPLLVDDPGIRWIGHPEERITLAAAHLAARTDRLENALV